MKKIIKVIGIASVLLLYFYTISYYGRNTFAADSAITNNQASRIDNYLPNTSVLFFIHQNQNIVENSNNIPTPVRKTHHFNSFTSSKQFEFSQLSTYSKSIFYTTHTVIQFQKTDIIFPFHYFL